MRNQKEKGVRNPKPSLKPSKPNPTRQQRSRVRWQGLTLRSEAQGAAGSVPRPWMLDLPCCEPTSLPLKCWAVPPSEAEEEQPCPHSQPLLPWVDLQVAYHSHSTLSVKEKICSKPDDCCPALRNRRSLTGLLYAFSIFPGPFRSQLEVFLLA